ncbi:MAG: SpoIVB peptidase [Clostridia bacterium]|nr:SpoIVB peptidase [Clostridia bacterium]
MKILKSKIFIISFISVLLLSVSGIILVSYSLPEKVVISPEDSGDAWLPQKLNFFLNVKESQIAPALENSSKPVQKSQNVQTYNAKVYFCNVLPVKTVEVSVVDRMLVTPGGECIGINLKTEGVLVVGIAKFQTKSEITVSPGQEAGICTGDSITKINGTSVSRAYALADIIAKSSGEITIEGLRNSKPMVWKVTPACDKTDNTQKIGLWIRESVAGIGTATFYKDGHFASLGHPISDIDTGEDVSTNGGTICSADIVGVDRGKKGTPGSLLGVFSGEGTGEITANTNCGVYGTTTHIPQTPKVEIALKNKVRPGNATIRCDIGNGKVEEFKIEIARIVSTGNTPKNMIIKITDKKLLDKTGGVVQGMSGSPILQNGKLIGAVTHVFVNDPTRGYGIFIENMLAEAEKIK